MGHSRMDNPEILARLATEDFGQIHARENRWDNQEWTIKGNWQRWAHKTQDK